MKRKVIVFEEIFLGKMKRFLKTLITVVSRVKIVRYERNSKHNLSFIKCFEPE